MKKAIMLVLLLLLASYSAAQEVRPVTVKGLDATITMTAAGSFSGSINRGDELEIQFLSIREHENQEIVFLEEHLLIGGDTLKPDHVEKNGLTYASYKIDDLQKYASTPTFEAIRKARIRTTAKLGVGEDHSLSSPITGFSDYMGETKYIESEDPELKSKASIEFGSDSEIETIREITEWVNNNIEYNFESYYNGIYSAKQTYNSREGVCDEFANLTAAFARIRGIPAKYITGISFDGERFGMHGWTELYVPGTGWIGVDSTYGEAGYLDAAHIKIAETPDAGDAIDFIAITKSLRPIQVDSELGLPQVTINKMEFFEGLFDTRITKPRGVGVNEVFTLEAEVTNKTGENIIVPVELVLHEDFYYKNRQQLAFIKAGEAKTVSWEVQAPNKNFTTGEYQYAMILLMPDGNRNDTLRLVPRRTVDTGSERVSIEDVSPFIVNSDLKVEVRMRNLSSGQGTVSIALGYEETSLEEQETTLSGFEEKTVTRRLTSVKPGKVILIINNGEEHRYEIIVPEKKEEPVEIVPDYGEPEKGPFGGQVFSGQFENFGVDQNALLIILGGIVVVAIAVIAVPFIRA